MSMTHTCIIGNTELSYGGKFIYVVTCLLVVTLPRICLYQVWYTIFTNLEVTRLSILDTFFR